MTIKKLKEWVEYCGFECEPPPANKQGFYIRLNKKISIGEDIPRKSHKVTGTALRWICFDKKHVYLDSNLHGMLPEQVFNRYHLKQLLE